MPRRRGVDGVHKHFSLGERNRLIDAIERSSNSRFRELRDTASALIHHVFYLLDIRHPFVGAKLLHHGKLVFAESLFPAMLHELLHLLEIRFAVRGTALFHHLVHHRSIPPECMRGVYHSMGMRTLTRIRLLSDHRERGPLGRW